MGNAQIYTAIAVFLFLPFQYSYSQSISSPEIDSIQLLILSEKDDSMIVNYLSSISYNYRDLDSDSAIHYGLRTLELAQEISSDYRIARVRRFMADTYEQFAEFSEARQNYEEAIAVFDRIGKKDEVATTLLSLSIVLTKEYKTEQAIEILHELIDISDETGDWDLGAYSRINLSGLYINQLDYEEALTQLEEAGNVYNGLDLSDDALREYIDQQKPLLYNNLGTAYQGLNQLDSAVVFFSRALDQTEINRKIESTIEIENDSWKALSLFNLGFINEKTKNWNTALDYYQEARKVYTVTQNREGAVASIMRAGRMQMQRENYSEAIELLNKALTGAQEMNSFQKLRDTHEILAEYYAKVGKADQALEQYRKYNIYRDSILTVERIRANQDMQTKWDTERIEVENQRVNAENQLAAQKLKNQNLYFAIATIVFLGLVYVGYSRYKIQQQKAEAARAFIVRQAMEKFVPVEFLSSIGRNRITEVQLGDQSEQIITVMFTDIRSFTSISEQMTPKENFEFVRAYASIMGPIIKRHNGFINQYLGDGLMVLFKDSPDDALIAAIDMQMAIREINKEGMLLDQELKVGMGMHTGSLIMGIIGDETRLDATLISDTVNSAARIESATKTYGADILLSEASYAGLSDRSKYHLKTVGETFVKGKKKPLSLIQCFSEEGTYYTQV